MSLLVTNIFFCFIKLNDILFNKLMPCTLQTVCGEWSHTQSSTPVKEEN